MGERERERESASAEGGEAIEESRKSSDCRLVLSLFFFFFFSRCLFHKTLFVSLLLHLLLFDF